MLTGYPSFFVTAWQPVESEPILLIKETNETIFINPLVGENLFSFEP